MDASPFSNHPQRSTIMKLNTFVKTSEESSKGLSSTRAELNRVNFLLLLLCFFAVLVAFLESIWRLHPPL